MSEDAPYVPRLPEHPELREIALVIERMGMLGEILDDRFRSVFVSSQTARAVGLSPDEARGLLGMSRIARTFKAPPGGDPVRRPGGIRRSLAAPVVPWLLRVDPRRYGSDRLVRGGT